MSKDTAKLKEMSVTRHPCQPVQMYIGYCNACTARDPKAPITEVRIGNMVVRLCDACRMDLKGSL